MWFPCGVPFLFFSSGTPPLLWELLDRTRNIFEMLSKYIYLKKCNCGFFWRVKKKCVCTRCSSSSSRSAGGRHCVLESQQESVCPGSLSQTSTNQQKQMGVCSAGPGGQWKIRRSFGTESFFFFLLSLLSYLLKEALTGARTILGNVFPVFHLSLPSFLLIPSSFQLLQFTQQRSRFTLPPPPRRILLSRSVPSLTLFKLTSDCHIWSPPRAADSLIRCIVHVELW